METDNLVMKNISYLKARDPSILSFNRPQLAEVKSNLINKFGEITQQQKHQQERFKARARVLKADRNIRVYLRIKNGYDFKDLYEIDGHKLTSKIPPGSNLMRNIRDGDSMRKIYTFTKIFQPETTQRDVFNNVVKPKMLEFINGENSTLLTYGASGSGKTFTVIGTDEAPGVVPRSLEYLFSTLPKLSKNPTAKPSPAGDVTLLNENECKKEKLLCRSLLSSSYSSVDRAHHLNTYLAMQQRLSTEPAAELEDQPGLSLGVWVSFAEIYNEHIYDLLQQDPPRGKQRPKLRLGMANNGQPFIKDLTSVSVTTGQEAYQIMQFGIHNLNYAATQLNKHSSRSHSIFTIKLVQVSKIDGGSYVSCFNFCDLAGSERSKKTNNVGDRLKESNNINSSLLVLGRCISAVRDLQRNDDHKLIPFRDSKLTQLFQRALSGSEDISMIVNISPSLHMFDETQHVLIFSAIAKDVVIDRKPEPVINKKKNRFSQLVEESEDDCLTGYSLEDYKNTVLLLQEELEAMKHEHEMDIRMNLDYAREEYQKHLKKQEEQMEARIKRAEKRIQLQYESKIDNMKLKYEKIIEELEENNEIIEIDSSDEEENSLNGSINSINLKNMKKSDLRELVKEGMEESKQLRQECKILQQKCDNLEAKIIDQEHDLEMYQKLAMKANTTSESEDSEEELDVNKTNGYKED